MALQHLRSGTANKRPNPSAMADGQLALNYETSSPGLFLKDSNGALVKVGPVHVGTTAPNASPAVGGTAGNSKGEVWLDTSLTPVGIKVWTGSAWSNATPVGSTTVQGLLQLATNAETQTGSDATKAVTPAGLQSKLSDSTSTTSSTTIASSTAVKSAYDLANAALPKSGGRVTGNLEIGPTGSLTFEGSTDDAFETTLTVVDPTADRTIALPNVNGTVVTTGDTGTVTSTMIADGTIVNADVSASAAIAGTKISPDFGSQNVTTSGNVNIDSGTFYVDAVNNRVGIGTTGPAFPVDAQRTSAGTVGRFYSTGGTDSNISIRNNTQEAIIGADNTQSYLLNASAYPWTFWTNNTKQMTLDASGNLGLGVVPSAWNSSYKAIQFGSRGSISNTGGFVITGNNFYEDSSNVLRYLVNAQASYTAQVNGEHRWHTSTNTPSAGGAITFTQAMTLDASGNLGVGATSPTARLHLATSSSSGTSNADGIRINSGGNVAINIGSNSSIGYGWIQSANWGSGYIPTVINPNGGNVGIGTTSPVATLHSRTDNAGSGSTPLLIQNRSVSANTAVGISFAPNTSDTADRSAVIYGVNSSGGAGNGTDLAFHTNANGSSPTEKMRLDASGNLGLGVVPSANGSIYYRTFELGKAGCGLFVGTSSLSGSELTYFAGNAVLSYNAGPLWSYGNAGGAAAYGIEDGVHKWLTTTTTGTTGGAITFTQAMTLDASGNLGIGTTAPYTRTQIEGDQVTYPLLGSVVGPLMAINTTNNADTTALRTVLTLGRNGKSGVSYGNYANFNAGRYSQAGSAGNTQLTLRLNQGNVNDPDTDVMTWFANGNVGIGTSEPGTRLDARFPTSPGTDNGAGFNALRSFTTSALAVNTGGAISLGGVFTGNGDVAAFAQIAGRKENATSGDLWGYLQFCTNTGGGTMLERMRITGPGNVGIGTTTAPNKLSIGLGDSVTDGLSLYYNGAGTNQTVARYHANTATGEVSLGGVAANYYLTLFTNGSERARIDSSGRLLVGTTSWSGSSTNAGGIQITSSNYVAGGQVTGLLGSWRASANDNNGGADVGIDYYRVPRGGGVQSGTEMRFYTGFSYLGGTYQRMTLDQDGRLLVGTTSTSDSAKFLMQGNAVDSGGGAIINLCNGKATLVDGEATGIIRFSDNTHAEAATIMVARDGGTWSASSKPTRLVFSTTANGAASPTERMRIDNAGNVTFNSGKAYIYNTGDIEASIINDANANGFIFDTGDGGSGNRPKFRIRYGTADQIYLDGSGNAQKPGGGSWAATSDIRAKEHIIDYTSGLDELIRIQPRSYRYIGNENTYVGLVAQEVENIMPELVKQSTGLLPDGTEVDDFRTLDQTPLTFALINAVKEMAERIEQLEAIVASLQAT